MSQCLWNCANHGYKGINGWDIAFFALVGIPLTAGILFVFAVGLRGRRIGVRAKDDNDG